jgi:hypothetical protein
MTTKTAAEIAVERASRAVTYVTIADFEEFKKETMRFIRDLRSEVMKLRRAEKKQQQQ